MNILLICECDKRALKETRRILDQFAQRRGERTWQTPITKEGLDTLHRLLRKFKPHVVNCHRGEGFFLWAMLRQRMNSFALVRTRGDQRPPGMGSHAPEEVLRVLWRVQEEFLDAALHMVDNDFGGLQTYLVDVLGVDAAAQQELAGRYLQAV